MNCYYSHSKTPATGYDISTRPRASKQGRIKWRSHCTVPVRSGPNTGSNPGGGQIGRKKNQIAFKYWNIRPIFQFEIRIVVTLKTVCPFLLRIMNLFSVSNPVITSSTSTNCFTNSPSIRVKNSRPEEKCNRVLI